MSDEHLDVAPESFGASHNRRSVARAVQAEEAEVELRALASRDWRATMRGRLLIGGAVVALWIVGIEARLVFLQVVQHDELVARAERQRNKTIDMPAKRGDLVDRAGHVLAYSVDGDAIFAEPMVVPNPRKAAADVCRALDACGPKDLEQIRQRLSQRRAFVYLWRRATPREAENVRNLGIRGIGTLREDRRYYPNRDLASHVLGYVGLDNTGLGGIEASRNALISGLPGKVLLQTDAHNRAFGRIQREPTSGASLELTIDRYLQYVAERELEAGVAEHKAAGGTVIIMEPHTGDVLAMANWPRFNPNAYQSSPKDTLRNRAVQEIYEPGSTFKVVTASAALNERLVSPGETFDVSAGQIRFGARVIEDVHRYGSLSFSDVIVKSSNVGAIKVGLRVGAERLSRYVRMFGFGQGALGELPGETRGIVWDPSALNDSALASVSMGYQVSVTPIQMAAAVSAVANGGEFVAPRVVRAVIRDRRRIDAPRKATRGTVRRETAATLTTIMEAVVEEGTAKAARLEGYTVAGKTGTAAKLEGGRYSKSDYNASFVGFVPSRAPVVTILVVIDSPHGKGYYGGAVAAPIFKRIAEKTLRHLGAAPTINPGPTVLVARSDGGAASPSADLVRTAPVLLPMAGRPAIEGLMPDLRGMGAREAVNAVARLGLAAYLQGDGVVVDQSVSPGERVERGGTCVLRLERRAPTAPGAGAVP